MPKVVYDGITFDSELEIDYYKYLKENNIKFIYHPKNPIMINSKNKYTPDFICFYNDKIEIIETKGYNQFSFMKDNMIHNVMLEKTNDELLEYLYNNGVVVEETIGKDILYKKIKYLKQFGWVDFDFKNPNTLSNKRKEKINDLELELKELKEFKKDVDRYFSYLTKIKENVKLTKPQLEWKKTFEEKNNI